MNIDFEQPQLKRQTRHGIGDEISGVLIFVGTIWLTFFLDWFLPLSEWFALLPRYASGLPGVVASPFLHDGWGHLLANTVPLVVLLTLLAGSRANSWKTVLGIALLSGALLWLFGRNGTPAHHIVHVGASGLVFGLVTFFLAAAYFEMRIVPMVIALIVGFLYGWSTLMGMLPTSRGISWDGHLCGAVAGVIVAFWQTRPNVAEQKPVDSI